MSFFKLFYLMLLILLFSTFSWAKDNTDAQASKTDAIKSKNKIKQLSGISIIGNKEAPKSLYIVPWKNSQVGVRSSLSSGLLDESMRPIDKDVFIRELEFYKRINSK